MVDGRINKFYKEVCLLKQPFVKDGEIDVAEYIEKTGKGLGGTIKVADFVRYERVRVSRSARMTSPLKLPAW